MRILADENVPASVVIALRKQHDVLWILEDAPQSSDRDVLALAQEHSRILLTFDKDFGELAFKARLPATSGIILVRPTSPDPAGMAHLVERTIEERNDWAGYFSVIERDRYRMTELPRGT